MLTDEDRAVIKEAWHQEHTLQCDAAQYAYFAGLRLGQERMRERAAEAAKSAGYGMVDVLHPHGQPGSYARGEYIGTIDATIATVNAIRALKVE